MSDPIRLSLAVSTEPRDSTHLDKDSSLTNCFIDKDPNGVTYVTKRPGFTVSTEAITTGLVRGIYINPYTIPDYTSSHPLVWYVGSNNTSYGNLNWFIGGYINWDNSDTYDINDAVAYDDGTGPSIYYSAIDNNTGIAPSTTTNPGNIYWSPVAFDSTRYFGTYRNSNGPTTASAASAGYAAWSAFETFKLCSDGAVTWYVYNSIQATGFPYNQPMSIMVQQYSGTCAGFIPTGIAPGPSTPSGAYVTAL